MKMGKNSLFSRLSSFLLFLGCLRLAQSMNTLMPTDVTVPTGANAVFQCNFDTVSSSSPFIWASYSPKPTIIYSTSNSSVISGSSKYVVNSTGPYTGPYTLTVLNAQSTDAMPYSCYTIQDSNNPSWANLVVIGSLTPLINGNTQSTGLTVGSIVNMICTLSYSGPAIDNPDNPCSSSQDPQLNMLVGSTDITGPVQLNGTGQALFHTKTTSTNYTITSSNIGQYLYCKVSSTAPALANFTNTSLNVIASTKNIYITYVNMNNSVILNPGPQSIQFPLNTVFICVADGYPYPTITWTDIGNNNNQLSVSNGQGNNCSVTVQKQGNYQWNCSATNSQNLIPATVQIKFSVLGSQPSTSKGQDQSAFGIGRVVAVLLGILAHQIGSKNLDL